VTPLYLAACLSQQLCSVFDRLVVVHVEQSVHCVCVLFCVQTITFEPIYQACWFSLTLPRTSSMIKVKGQSSPSQDEVVFLFRLRVRVIRYDVARFGCLSSSSVLKWLMPATSSEDFLVPSVVSNRVADDLTGAICSSCTNREASSSWDP